METCGAVRIGNHIDGNDGGRARVVVHIIGDQEQSVLSDLRAAPRKNRLIRGGAIGRLLRVVPYIVRIKFHRANAPASSETERDDIDALIHRQLHTILRREHCTVGGFTSPPGVGEGKAGGRVGWSGAEVAVAAATLVCGGGIGVPPCAVGATAVNVSAIMVSIGSVGATFGVGVGLLNKLQPANKRADAPMNKVHNSRFIASPFKLAEQTES